MVRRRLLFLTFAAVLAATASQAAETALGHKPEHYSDPILYNHILGGILWAMGEKK
ncbi:MAG TPA: hypothetical protein VN428_10720 [Bryobacteraceae bacterium]|nr:hypothetical protein [Bryobacteraceae bacterium]